MHTAFRARLLAGDRLIGTLISLPSPEVAELLAEGGFDWLFAAIARVPGVDAVLIGPYDLSASMGKPGQITDPEVRGAIDTVRRECLAARVRLGIFGLSAAAVRPYLEEGFTLITVGMDTVFLSQAARAALAELGR